VGRRAKEHIHKEEQPKQWSHVHICTNTGSVLASHMKQARATDQPPNNGTMDGEKCQVQLLTEMRNIVYGLEAHIQGVWSLCQQIKFLVTENKENNKSNKKYMERFHDMWEALRQQGGSLTNHPSLVQARA